MWNLYMTGTGTKQLSVVLRKWQALRASAKLSHFFLSGHEKLKLKLRKDLKEPAGSEVQSIIYVFPDAMNISVPALLVWQTVAGHLRFR